MKNSLTLLVAILIVSVLLVYMFLFQVRYDQVAVVTTFGKAGPNSIKLTRKWPYLRWPWPIQTVTRYPKRLQILEDQLEEQQSADGYGVIINTYLAWRIENPLKFFAELQQIEKAEEQLNAKVRDARAIISQYRFNQLVNTDSTQVKLAEIEQRVEKQLQDQVGDLGVHIEQFGIRRNVLPEIVTENVFAQMRATRETRAEDTLSMGIAEAAMIKSQADSIRTRILAFANGYAEKIRAKGDKEAAAYFDIFAEDQDFAIFMRKLEAMQEIFRDSTVIIPADELITAESVMSTSMTQGNP